MNRKKAGILQQCTVPAVFLLPTADPYVFIEEQREDYTRYQNSLGRRWEVFGICVKLGHCLVGATIDGEYIESLERAQELAYNYIGLDSPITPEFKGCCPFTFNELGDVNGN